jgi:hypothetical protein
MFNDEIAKAIIKTTEVMTPEHEKIKLELEMYKSAWERLSRHIGYVCCIIPDDFKRSVIEVCSELEDEINDTRTHDRR